MKIRLSSLYGTIGLETIDQCKGCVVPARAEKLDPFESEYYFDCSMCACYDCEHLHSCKGQCTEKLAEK